MTQYRKKPVVINAVRFGGPDDIESIRLWSGGKVIPHVGDPVPARASFLVIHTLEGAMTATPGDWIIRGVQGEYYPCKPDIFDTTYEEVQ